MLKRDKLIFCKGSSNEIHNDYWKSFVRIVKTIFYTVLLMCLMPNLAQLLNILACGENQIGHNHFVEIYSQELSNTRCVTPIAFIHFDTMLVIAQSVSNMFNYYFSCGKIISSVLQFLWCTPHFDIFVWFCIEIFVWFLKIHLHQKIPC